MPQTVHHRSPRPRACQPEEAQQAALVRWARTQPGLALLLHVPNGGDRRPPVAARMVALGARRGVPDLMLPIPVGPYHGLWLEFKAEDGAVSHEQRRWLDALAGHGYAACVAFGLAAAQRCLLAYLDGAVMPERWT